MPTVANFFKAKDTLKDKKPISETNKMSPSLVV